MTAKKTRSPIVRIGIDLDHIIVTEDGTLVPEGFEAFVQAQRDSGSELFLVGCFDGKVGDELKELGFFDKDGMAFQEEDLFLCEDGNARNAKIKELRLSHYIAGDADVFGDKKFSKRSQPILFSYEISSDYPTFADWVSVDLFLNWYAGVRKQKRGRLRSIEPIKEHGDNFIYRLTTQEGTEYVLKRYYEKNTGENNRLQNEARSLRALGKAGVDVVPVPLWDDRQDWAIFNMIKGTHAEGTDDDVEQLIRFLIELDEKGKDLRRRNLPRARDARLNLKAYVKGIATIWDPIMQAAQSKGPQDVMLFMMTDLEQLRQDNINHFYLWCKRENWNQERELPMDQRIFSPGDFGFHNSIRSPEGRLSFLDFENAGWDDPAKLMADFFYNTQQNLAMDQKLKVLDAFVKHRDWDKDFMKRFWAVSDLVAVEWIVRRLRVVVPAEQTRLMLADPNTNIKKLIAQRLEEAMELRSNYTPMERLCKHVQLIDESTELT
ncbi:MAG: aminoglycoside phosphotransferase family protein [Acidobacteriota bacterium]|nr:aminoglycoside phosphotransferase family protein [Acidobacteriota bacterium]